MKAWRICLREEPKDVGRSAFFLSPLLSYYSSSHTTKRSVCIIVAGVEILPIIIIINIVTIVLYYYDHLTLFALVLL